HAGGAVPVVATVLRLPYPAAEVPENVAAAIAASEVTIAPASQPITHSRTIQEAISKHHRRFVSMPGITEHMMTAGASTVDHDTLESVTKATAEALKDARSVRAESRNGTSIEFSIEGRTVYPNYGVIAGDWGLAMFPDGEVSVAPVEDSLNGTIVVDGYQLGVGALRQPLRLTLRNGIVTSVEGGLEARALRRLIEAYGDVNTYRVGEFAIGTNPEAQLIGSAGEDKKMLGTIHFSLGDNLIMGGRNQSKLHLDGVVLFPSLHVDGETLIEDRVLKLQGSRRLLGE
ncbi:MAG: aminopeptidase, partial [Candidatus Bathyarchaeia archaeon]